DWKNGLLVSTAPCTTKLRAVPVGLSNPNMLGLLAAERAATARNTVEKIRNRRDAGTARMEPPEHVGTCLFRRSESGGKRRQERLEFRGAAGIAAGRRRGMHELVANLLVQGPAFRRAAVGDEAV